MPHRRYRLTALFLRPDDAWGRSYVIVLRLPARPCSTRQPLRPLIRPKALGSSRCGRNRRIFPLPQLAPLTEHCGAGTALAAIAETRNRRGRLRVSPNPRAAHARREAADARVEAARTGRRAGRARTELLRARARLHQGSPLDRRRTTTRPARSVVGIHNGRIVNDDELLASIRARTGGAGDDVDSEAIFASRRTRGTTPARLRSCTARWRRLARRARARRRCYSGPWAGRPLWLGECRDGIFFASTEHALEVVERYCGLKLRKREVRAKARCSS